MENSPKSAQTTGPSKERPLRRQREVYDGVELSDDDLELVVGGLSAEAYLAHSRYLLGLRQKTDPNAT
jgi:hypothetical protein